MASNGIRDRVAIVGMGCTEFGEHWDRSTDDLLIDASQSALTSAGMDLAAVDAFWLGTMGSGLSGLVGMYLSYHLDVSSGATIVLVNFALFCVVYGVTGHKGHRRLAGVVDHQHGAETELVANRA